MHCNTTNGKFDPDWYNDGQCDELDLLRDEVISHATWDEINDGDYSGHWADHAADIEHDMEQWCRDWSIWKCLNYLDRADMSDDDLNHMGVMLDYEPELVRPLNQHFSRKVSNFSCTQPSG